MGIVDEQLLSYVREQAGEWLKKGPALKSVPMYAVIDDAIGYEAPEPVMKDDIQPSPPEEAQEDDAAAKPTPPPPPPAAQDIIPSKPAEEEAAAKPTPPPPPRPLAPKAPDEAEEPQVPRGGDLAADAAAGANCVASEQVSHLGSSLHHVKDATCAEEPEAQCNEEAPEPKPEPVEFSIEDTLLIFDWDDTILPSSWVAAQKLRLDRGYDDLTEAQRGQLAQIATVAINTIQSARECGQVIIITNAERGWVELTCHKFLPELAPLLEGVRVVSARSAYECTEGPNPQDWKLRAFEHEIQRAYGDSAHDPRRAKNVVSLGDSVHEREAVMRATAVLPNCRCKSLKFTAKPDIAQIYQQHTLIKESFEQIVKHDGHLDLCLRCN